MIIYGYLGQEPILPKKGGDIDLYIETYKNAKDAVEANYRFLSILQKKIGEQKIDVVLNLKDSNVELLIYTVAKSDGIQIL